MSQGVGTSSRRPLQRAFACTLCSLVAFVAAVFFQVTLLGTVIPMKPRTLPGQDGLALVPLDMMLRNASLAAAIAGLLCWACLRARDERKVVLRGEV
jgi:hypothetical protein